MTVCEGAQHIWLLVPRVLEIPREWDFFPLAQLQRCQTQAPLLPFSPALSGEGLYEQKSHKYNLRINYPS